jgi:putative transposase
MKPDASNGIRTVDSVRLAVTCIFSKVWRIGGMESQSILRSYKFRIYPNAAQRHQLAVDMGCARFVWNRALAFRSESYKLRGERHNQVSLSKLVTQWKQVEEMVWLREANSTVLTQALIDQDKAFANFFAKRAKYPRFKKRHDGQSVRYQLDQRQIARNFIAGKLLRLPKIGTLKVRWSRVPSGIPKMATVAKDACGRFFVSFTCEETVEAWPATHQVIGVDVGIKDIAVTSDGDKSGNPKHLAAKLRRLKRYQRRVSRKELARKKAGRKTSNRHRRARIQLAKVHARVAHARNDFLQKLTTDLVRRADVICFEDLHVRGMLRNRKIARVLGDAAVSRLITLTQYKAHWYGRQILYAGRWDPTSKRCSDCGYIHSEMPLSIRAWTCPECGVSHDRDINAARNIVFYATGGKPGGWAPAAPHARGGVNPPEAATSPKDSCETRTEASHATSRMDRVEA